MPDHPLLARLPAGEPVYALLDGARDRRIRSFILDTRAPAWCLYRGVPAVLEDAAPWLLRLVPGQPYTSRFFERGWNNAWGILLTSPAPSRALRRHLRRFLRVRTEDGRVLVFRYYDPRVLRVFLPTCTPAERAAFFGPIGALAAESSDGATAHLFHRDGPPAPPPRKLLAIRDPQMRALAAGVRDSFLADLVKALRLRSPERAALLSQEALLALAAGGVDKAGRYGLAGPGEVLRFLLLILEWGEGFDERRDTAWAGRALRLPGTGRERLDQLEADAREARA